MKIITYLFLFSLMTLQATAASGASLSSTRSLAFSDMNQESTFVSERKKERKIDFKDPKTLSIIAFIASISGVLLIALPYVSLLGLFLGLGGLVLGWMMRKRVQKKIWAKLAIVIGGLCLLFFLATLALILFF